MEEEFQDSSCILWITNGRIILGFNDTRNLVTVDRRNFEIIDETSLVTVDGRNLVITDERNLTTTDGRKFGFADRRIIHFINEDSDMAISWDGKWK
jgi:ribosomal protein S4E